MRFLLLASLCVLSLGALSLGSIACSPSQESSQGPAGTATPELRPPASNAVYDPPAARQLTVDAVAACQQDDFLACRELLRRAVSHRPGQVEIWMLLAGVDHRLGRESDAEAALARVVATGLEPPFERAPFFDTLLETDIYRQALAELASRGQPLTVSEPLLRLDDRDLIPEGVAFDSATGSWYVSSVHRRTIVRWRDGVESRWLADGALWSVLGLAIDVERRLLWATTAALPQMVDFDEALAGRSALVALDLDALGLGTLGLDTLGLDRAVERRRVELADDQPHVLNDLTLGADGSVFVSDNRLPGEVYQLLPGASELRPVAPEGFFRSPQGLALSDDGRRLYVADYSFGLTVVELPGSASVPGVPDASVAAYLPPPQDACLTGIDGLASAGSSEGNDVLIAVQNLYKPNRVLRLEVDPRARQVVSVTVLEQARPDYSEPTLGTVVDGAFIYVANSQWNRFDEAAALPPIDQLERPLLLRLPL